MRYVIIGNSAAGIGAVEGMRQVDQNGAITLITSEPHHTYSRPLISYLLRGKVTEEKMKYRGDDFYAEHDVRLLHATATSIDVEAKQVVLSDGGRVPYDKLLVATGSSAFVPPFEGIETVKDRFTFMSLDDAKSLDGALGPDKRVLVVGAGLIGLKCAEGILGRVASVTVTDLAPRILSSILDEDGARLVQDHLESKGIAFRLSDGVKRFEGDTAIFEGGGTVDFDVLVLAVGVRPNVALLNGVANIDGGIVVDEESATSVADVYAAGDCTQTRDASSGRSRVMALLPNAYMQGECAGVNMAGGRKKFDKAIPMNAIGFFGLHVITAGNYEGETYTECGEGRYKRLFYSEEKSTGAEQVPQSGTSERCDSQSTLLDLKGKSTGAEQVPQSGTSKRCDSQSTHFYSEEKSASKLNGYILVGDVEKAGIYTSLVRENTPLDTIDFALVCEKPGLMAFAKEDRMAKLGGGIE